MEDQPNLTSKPRRKGTAQNKRKVVGLAHANSLIATSHMAGVQEGLVGATDGKTIGRRGATGAESEHSFSVHHKTAPGTWSRRRLKSVDP